MANKKTKKDAELAKMIYGIIILVAIFFIFYYLFKDIGKIEKEGLTFTKESIGKIIVYHYYYIYQDKDGQLVQNNIYLRENPEKNEIPVYGSDIYYVDGKFAYVSINASAMQSCQNSNLALAQLSSFLVNGGVQVRGAVMEKNVTNTTSYRTCEIDKNNPIIQINKGNESRIDIDNLCYNIQFNSCDDLLPGVERFIIESIVDARQQTAKEVATNLGK